MNGADIVICLVLLVSIVAGLVRGFVREAVSLVFLVGGVIAAWVFGPRIEPHLGGYLAAPSVRPWVARLIILVLVLLIGSFVGALTAYLMRSAGLGFVDRVLGVLFGALRGAILVGLLVIGGDLVHLNHEAWWNRSKLIPYGQMIGGWVRVMVGDGGAHWAKGERVFKVGGG
ncbi:MAG: CvpA family protein [Steroidobacteraceae bacterium]|nr:CvpA family protein [Steroidobacteraceae bacterium]